MNDYKKYCVLQGSIVLLALVSIGATNFRVDPAGLYSDKKSLIAEYVDTLIHSEYGLYKPRNSWGEREIKKLLVHKSASTDCIILGSSHVMEVSSSRPNKSLKNRCSSILNLGVSGGTLEDFLALSYEIISSELSVKYVVFGIAPWSLDYRRDYRWQKYNDSKMGMLDLIESSALVEFISNIESQWTLLVNLINYQYLLSSMDYIKKEGVRQEIDKENAIQKVEQEFDLRKGLKEAVTLKDGSHVYARQYIIENTPPSVRIGGSSYKIRNEGNINSDAVRMFSSLVRELHDKKIGVILLLTPYHHNVWKDKASDTTKALLEVEPFVKGLGRELGVEVLGSYNPTQIGCDSSEFFDHMHARDSCLSKIIN